MMLKNNYCSVKIKNLEAVGSSSPKIKSNNVEHLENNTFSLVQTPKIQHNVVSESQVNHVKTVHPKIIKSKVFVPKSKSVSVTVEPQRISHPSELQFQKNSSSSQPNQEIVERKTAKNQKTKKKKSIFVKRGKIIKRKGKKKLEPSSHQEPLNLPLNTSSLTEQSTIGVTSNSTIQNMFTIPTLPRIVPLPSFPSLAAPRPIYSVSNYSPVSNYFRSYPSANKMTFIDQYCSFTSRVARRFEAPQIWSDYLYPERKMSLTWFRKSLSSPKEYEVKRLRNIQKTTIGKKSKQGKKLKLALTQGVSTNVSSVQQSSVGTLTPTSFDINDGSDPLKMAIVLEDFPDTKLSSEQFLLIEEAMAEHFQILAHGRFPQFTMSYVEDGAHIVVCENNETKKWVEDVIPMLKPWKKAKLWTSEKIKILTPVKVTFKAPKMFSKFDPNKVLEIFGKQNNGLRTSEWKIVSYERTNPTGQRFVVRVDKLSFDALQSINMNPFLGIGKIEVSELKD